MSLRHHRTTALAFLVSAALHLLLLLLPWPRATPPAPDRVVLFRAPWRSPAWRFIPAAPAAQAPGLRRLAPLLPGLPRLDVAASQPPHPLAAAGDSGALLDVQVTWEPEEKEPLEPAPDTTRLDLDRLELQAHRDRVRQREGYARLRLHDADTTGAASAAARRARAVVLRAVAAMGGLPALLAIRQMRVCLGVVASEDVRYVRSGVRVVDVIVNPRPPFVYPVAEWRCGPRDRVATGRLEPADLSPESLLNPERSLQAYYRLFEDRWHLAGLSPSAGRLRQEGEAARWHFLDRFLGEEIVLEYLGQERDAEVIRATDCRFGSVFDARFSRSTGLLASVVEGLAESERAAHVAGSATSGPTWETQYLDYRSVQGVMTALTLRRTRRGDGPDVTSTVRLAVGYNGAAPEALSLGLE